tara:strand:+ start:685 stop:1209 length:525 start_codon:yes stop_codon:yes gene_type:complete
MKTSNNIYLYIMNLSIHSSFNKNDFIQYIEQNRVYIDSYYQLSKIELREKLNKILTDECYLHFRKKTHCLNIVLKNEILLKCKKINSLINGGFNYKNSFYDTIDDVINDAIHIAEFGDLSTVRKTIKKINPFLIHKIEPIISELKKKELHDRDTIKKQSNPILQIERKNILVHF